MGADKSPSNRCAGSIIFDSISFVENAGPNKRFVHCGLGCQRFVLTGGISRLPTNIGWKSAAEYVTNFRTATNITLFTARNYKLRPNLPQTVLPGNFWNGTKTTAFSANKGIDSAIVKRILRSGQADNGYYPFKTGTKSKRQQYDGIRYLPHAPRFLSAVRST